MSHAKAAALRSMLPWVAELTETRATDSRAAQLRATCLGRLADLDKVYRTRSRFLTVNQEKAAMGHCVEAMQALAELVRLRSQGPWRLIPKAHALMHLACDSALGNPRVAHCYQDEDFVGRVKRVYTACHGKTAPLRALQRYADAARVAIAAREELLEGKRPVKVPRLHGGPQRWSHAAGAADKPDGAAAPVHKLTRPVRGRPKLARPAPRPRGNPAFTKRPAP